MLNVKHCSLLARKSSTSPGLCEWSRVQVAEYGNELRLFWTDGAKKPHYDRVKREDVLHMQPYRD